MRTYFANLAILALLAASPYAVGQSITVFSPFGGGNSAGGGAFLVDSRIAPSARSQQVYAATDFTRFCEGIPCGVPDGSPMWITELRFTAINPPPDFNVTLQNIRIDLSTSAKVPDGLSSTFAENVGANDTIVYSGSLLLFNSGGGYGVRVSLQTPFLFDPSQGNLLLDVRNFATASPPGLGVRQFEGANTFGDTVSSVGANDVNSLTGGLGTVGMITWFQVAPIPEPSTSVLLIFGAALVVIIERRRRSAFRQNDSPGPQPNPKKG